MKALSLGAMQALFAENTDEVFVYAIRLSHSDWLDDTYLIADSDDMTYNGNVYKAFTFEVSLLPQREGGVPSVALSIDNTSLELIEFLRSVESDVSVDLSLFRRSPNGANTLEIGPVALKTSKFTADVSRISVTLSMSVDYLNEPATKDRFTPANAPGLF